VNLVEAWTVKVSFSSLAEAWRCQIRLVEGEGSQRNYKILHKESFLYTNRSFQFLVKALFCIIGINNGLITHVGFQFWTYNFCMYAN
jgi:hypothetical protein